jgi:hypothetical protein
MQASTTTPGAPAALTPTKQNAKAFALDQQAVFWLAFDQTGSYWDGQVNVPERSYELRWWDRTAHTAHDVPMSGDLAQIADIAMDHAAFYWVTYAGVVYRVAR